MAIVLVATGCDSLRARMMAQEGVNLYRKGQLVEAQKAFQQAERLDPHIPTVQLDLGFASLALYQNNPRSPDGQAAADLAIKAFQRYLQLRPGEERAKVYLIQTFVDTARYEEAVAFFKPQTEKDPPDPEALGTLGIIASKTGKYEEAKGWYEKRIAAQPQNLETRVQLGVLIWDYLHNHTELAPPDRIAMSDSAIAQFGEAIKLNPKAPAAYTYTNLVYRERSMAAANDDEKRKDLELALKFFKEGQNRSKGAK